VNLREQVAWSHPPHHEETQSLAEDYLRMGIVRAQKASPPKPYTEANVRTVLVVGGGMAGISAATSAARSGFGVVLVEREPRLGGYAAKLYRQFPAEPPHDALVEPDVEARLRELMSLPVTIHTRTEVRRVSGEPGRFHVTIDRLGEIEDVTVGAIVLATGWHLVPLD